MKPLRLNKAIGLALGERSAVVAEVAAGGADRPSVRVAGEFAYPDGVGINQPAELGAALAAYLKDQKFTARSAVVGLPARWLVVKPKDVPPADPATLADLLRLSAETEFSSELRDLVYDYAADATAGHPTSVLLIATPQKYLTAAAAVCDAAKLTAVAVTPSAVALGAATAAPVVMAIGTNGTELTAQSGAAPTALRHLRGPAEGDPKPFLGELRRAVSTLPVDGDRRMVLWGSKADVAGVNGSLGFDVAAGSWATLNVTGDADVRFAPAVALALSAVGDGRPAVDFLHPRLAAPKQRRVPRWAVWATAAAVLAVAAGVYGYVDLQQRQAVLTKLQEQVDKTHDPAEAATLFVDKVSFAQGWHGGNPRYLACLRDLTTAIPQDGETFATSLTLHEPPRPTGTAAIAAAPKSPGGTPLIGRLEGKTSDVIRAQAVVDRIKAVPTFTTVKLGGTTANGRDGAVSFSVTFIYLPPKPPAAGTVVAAQADAQTAAIEPETP